jgi:transcription-repair coupling factor (superfamily II helicase)
MSSTQTAPSAAERLWELPRTLLDAEGCEEALAALHGGGEATFDGVWGSACALLAAMLQRQAPGPLVVVAPNSQQLDDLCDDLELFSRAPAEKFPAWESEPGERLIHDEIYGDRLRTLKRLLDRQPPSLVVTSIVSLLQPTLSPRAVADNSRQIRRGTELAVEDTLRWLAEHGYQGTTAVELPGEFSFRGGILDIFAPDWLAPVRIELFDTSVESIRRFDVATQRSLESLDEVEVTVLAPSEAEQGHFSAFLPQDAWVLLVEPDQIADQAQHYLGRVEQPRDFHSHAEVMKQLSRFSLASAAGIAQGSLGAHCKLQIESVERFSGEFSHVREELDRVGQGHEVIVVAQTEAEVERLMELLSQTNLAGRGQLSYAVGYLHHGFRLVRESVLLVTGGELFHHGELRRTPKRRLGKAIDSFVDLREGDLVVHLAHGIGRYRGLKLIEKDGHKEEHLEIEFKGRTRIYVPAAKIDLVQKYVGGAKSRPTLATIGGATWLKQKKAAEAAVVDLASEMLELQAERVQRPGIAFARDTDWQREFDSSFPYNETDDQVAAIDSIKGDMHRPRPMDRLLCGDVGFGKTEVAMRAAFKAVENGYQVAVLVPTTILAEQHFRTFTERMAEFPFDIAKLSRFCTTAEQREVIKGLKSGRIDVVVGTHRLASQDVKFFNLGLVVIDEEQRFGVEVKERLKSLRTTVDVLTMSATPIPRTLHMSLVGVRDISNLETAPEDRMAVETRVTRFDDELIRHAVLRELNRGGQIYFVHNRVGDIHVLANKLKYIVPEADLRVGHGQMPEGELERVMVDFVAHKFDLLLATTIVESGLDIPNANTIFIDEADRYGLADLHQLRGRVGRYKHRAYAYLLIEPDKHITPNAARRLRAIEEFSDMGAGFAIAMRDLEIRGAGNLLGTQQSGHIANVGYELYCQLLENAVRQIKSMPPKMEVNVDVELPGEAYLPDDYVPDRRQKIDIYRRLTRVAGHDQVRDLREELIDRFGPPPEPVKRMLALARLKIDAAVWQISGIYIEDRYLALRYTQRGRIEQLAKLSGGRLRVADERMAYLTLKKGVTDPDDILRAAKSVLRL